jgi:hypothetical protein
MHSAELLHIAGAAQNRMTPLSSAGPPWATPPWHALFENASLPSVDCALREGLLWPPPLLPCLIQVADSSMDKSPRKDALPQVIQILIARDKETHQPKGSAYVWFQRRREAELAIRRLNGSATAMPDPANPHAKPLLVTVAQQSVAPVSWEVR